MAVLSDPAVFSNGSMVFEDPKRLKMIEVSDGLNVISN